MLEKINKNTDIVVANRLKDENGIARKIISKIFSFLFAKYLHGIAHDAQSGLKLFKKEILNRVRLNPSPWSFDLEFLVKAKNAGYNIESVDIVFNHRYSGESKINVLKAIFEIGFSALRLKFQNLEIVPFNHKDNKWHDGFHYKGNKFVHYNNLDFHESAFKSLSGRQLKIFGLLLAVLAIGIILSWHTTIIVLIALLSLLYFFDLLFNFFLIYKSFSKIREINVTDDEVNSLIDERLPIYTIFCPLYKEWKVLPQFVSAIDRLNYPKDKLQVLLLLEENDEETIKHAKNYKIPKYFETIIVPDSLPKTKPKACNLGLSYATGEYSVIFDAEDIPEPDQLKKTVIAFSKHDKSVVCIQAKLNFYNPHQNLLTKVFTAEYALWFDLVLTGLQSINAPIPLGGTSNHFRTSDLRELKGWDSFNVTEDCELGIRISKKGYKTAILNSYTHEEANSHIINWYWQRTRWIKGYIQTYLVHMRRPKEFFSGTKKIDLVTFQLVVGGKVISMLVNPIMWLITFVYFAFRAKFGLFIESFFPAPILYMGVFSLFIGNFLYMYYYMIGCAKRGYYGIIQYVFLVPLYWLAMSLAAYMSIVKLIQEPYYWSKTKHGLHLDNKKTIKQAAKFIGRNLVDDGLTLFPGQDTTPSFAVLEENPMKEDNLVDLSQREKYENSENI